MRDADTELFLEVKEGNDQSFSKLYQKYYPKTLNLIYRFIPDKEHAEDIAQDIFVRVYFGAKTFSPQSKFSTWLYKVTVNRCFSHHKKAKRERERYVIESDLAHDEKDDNPLNIENHPSTLAPPDEDIIKHEVNQEIQSALNKLPADQKMAFLLLEYDGLSYQEIARVSGASVKAVERRIYHARQKLKTLLKAYISP